MKPVTVYDIAKEANVSVATVSRVLNNTAPVKKETRERINELINKYQFQPNALARSLTKKETGMIGIILPDITNPFFRRYCPGSTGRRESKVILISFATPCPPTGTAPTSMSANRSI